MALRMNATSSPVGSSSSTRRSSTIGSSSSSKRKAARSMSPEPRQLRGKSIALTSKAKVPPAPKKGETIKSLKYPHVHQYISTGRWGAWYNDPTIPKLNRLYFGTHLTEELAARAQDRSLLMYRPEAIKPIKLHFEEKDYDEDKALRNKLTKKEFVKLICAESRSCYTKVEPTPCLLKFLKEEEALGHFPANFKLESGHLVNTKYKTGHLANKKGKPLAEYLDHLIEKRDDQGKPKDKRADQISKPKTNVKAKTCRTTRHSTAATAGVEHGSSLKTTRLSTGLLEHAEATPKQNQPAAEATPKQNLPVHQATVAVTPKQKQPGPQSQRPPCPVPTPQLTWIGKRPRSTPNYIDVD